MSSHSYSSASGQPGGRTLAALPQILCMALPSALGEFLPHEPRDLRVSSEFLRQLQDNMRTVLPPTHAFHGSRSAYTSDSLASTGYVYVRHDAHRKPLQRLYDGPFMILEAHEKYYVLDMNGRHDSVSVDRLKMHTVTKFTASLPLFLLRLFLLIPRLSQQQSHHRLQYVARAGPRLRCPSAIGRLGHHGVPHWGGGGPCGAHLILLYIIMLLVLLIFT